jgi:hypothetical protein
MARARRVSGIHPKESLRENARRVVAVRLDELLSWRQALDDPALVQQLHDMRIAAKRLRYALEMFDVCFSGVKALLKQLTDMQEDLGTIHDLDVLIVILRDRLQAVDATAEEQIVEVMGAEATVAEKSRQLRRLLSAQARDSRRLGLVGLIGDKRAERRRCYVHFQQRWSGGSLEKFAMQVRQVTGLAPLDTPVEKQPPDSGQTERDEPMAQAVSDAQLLEEEGDTREHVPGHRRI